MVAARTVAGARMTAQIVLSALVAADVLLAAADFATSCDARFPLSTVFKSDKERAAIYAAELEEHETQEEEVLQDA